jgi:hypothetical protein
MLVETSAAFTVYATVDSGSESGSSLFPASASNILGGRNYAPNIVLPVCSNLTLGWHIVKIRTSAANGFDPYGFGFLNESSSLNIRPGVVYGNNKVNTLTTAQNIAYGSDFETGTLGTKGGCVAVYLKIDGNIKKSVTAIPSTASALGYAGTGYSGSSADHTNEELIKTHYVREYGAGRNATGTPDDWSLGTGPLQRAFALDDSSEILVSDGSGYVYSMSGMEAAAGGSIGNWFTVHFVGSGIDILEGIL